MKPLHNENGIALVTSLLLTLISLTVTLAVLYLITQGIATSSAQKRYHNSLEAAHGGVELFSKEIIPRLMQGDSAATLTTAFGGINLAIPSSGCLSQKLNNSIDQWTACSGAALNSDPKQSPDMTFTLAGAGGSSNYKVYSKIVDSTPGNSDPSGIDYLDSGSGVTGTSSGVSPKHIPGLFRIEVEGEKEVNPNERALLSVLYTY
jgi:hypothetical protein